MVGRDPIEHRLVVTITRLSEFALLGQETDRTRYSYLPHIARGYAFAPDLVVTRMNASANSVTVEIENRGNAAVEDAFWVDVYFDPAQPPGLNQPWTVLADHGAVWGVTAEIEPGERLTLTTADQYFAPEYSSQPPFPVGTDVYAFVDSVDFSTTHGAVWESNEDNNRFGPVVSAAGTSGAAAAAVRQTGSVSRETLPAR